MATMEQLIAQVQLLTTKLAEQEAIVNSGALTRFQLTPSQIIKNFNDIKAFSGEDSYKLKSFLKAVDNAETLCGDGNRELREYCLKLTVNSKIIGKARNTILEIPENQRNWSTVVTTLTSRFRPKFTIHQLLFQAKEIKVYNLKDLFNKLTTIKSDISEICDFENNSTFTYESIDKELVLTLKSKVIPMLQIQIDENKTLFELDNEFCVSEIYLSTEVIKPIFKIQNSKFEKDKKQERFKVDEKLVDNKQNFTRNKSFNDNSGFKRNFDKNIGNNSGQFRPNSGQFRNRVEQMEIDNLVEIEEKDDEVEIVDENDENEEIETNGNKTDELDEVNFH